MFWICSAILSDNLAQADAMHRVQVTRTVEDGVFTFNVLENYRYFTQVIISNDAVREW